MDDSTVTTTLPDQDEKRIKRLKALIALAVVAVIALIAIPLVINYLGTGHLVITTNSASNSVTALRSTEGNGEDDTKVTEPQTLHSGKAVSLKPGIYVVSVKGSGGGVSQTVQIKARQTSRYTLNLDSSVTSIEPVADVNSLNFTADSSRLLYVDRQSNNLYQVDANNQLSQLPEPSAFTVVRWADPSFGIAQDSSGKLYVLNDTGHASPLTTLAATNNQATTYAIAPDHTIYVANGKDIYEGTATTAFKHIFTAGYTPFMIAASTDHAALFYNPGDGTKTGSKNDTPESVTIVDSAGKSVSEEIGAYDGAWSPSGKYLVTTDDSNTRIFDASLQPVAIAPNNNVNNFVWLDDNTLFYSVSNQLWKYSISAGKATQVASSPEGRTINAAAINSDKSYIYVAVESTRGSNDDVTIQRFGLNGQSVPSAIGKVHAQMPNLQGRCLISLTNFTKPTIQLYDDHPEDNCPAVASDYIRQLGVDPSLFSYVSTTIPPDEPTL